MPTDPTNEPTDEPTLFINPTNYPTIIPTNEPTIPFTEDACCHARDNTNRFELRCNQVSDIYIADCLSRYNQVRCDWEFEDIVKCPIIPGSGVSQFDGQTDCSCRGEILYSRRDRFCRTIDEYSRCMYSGCDYGCDNNS